jgi:hypothetical protein
MQFEGLTTVHLVQNPEGAVGSRRSKGRKAQGHMTVYYVCKGSYVFQYFRITVVVLVLSAGVKNYGVGLTHVF